MRYIADIDGERLDVFLSRMAGITRSAVKSVLEESPADVNGISRKKCGFGLKKGDEVIFEVLSPEVLAVVPSEIPIHIIYEDENFAVVNKPQGMVVHQAASYRKNDTLVNALMHSLSSLSTINGVIRPGIVHRLDKDTSGLLVVAKNDNAHNNLAKQIKDKTAERIYYALVDGDVKKSRGVIDAPIARSRSDRKKMAVDENGRRAVTHYEVILRFGTYTFVRYRLETGRTHQIRVHSAYIHHPIVGDLLYGGSTRLYEKGQLLHAGELKIDNPATGERMHFQCLLPDYFSDIVQLLLK